MALGFVCSNDQPEMAHLACEVRIDTEAGMEMLRLMSRLRAIVSAVLLILWMPATSHCAFESAGLLPAAVGCDSSSEAHCVGDGCRLIESGLFKQSTVAMKVMAPELMACTCMLCLQLVWASFPNLVAISDFTPPDFAAPQEWVARWSFEHRAALPARAPSLV